MPNNNVMRMVKNAPDAKKGSGYTRFIQHSALPVSFLIAIVAPALLVAIPTGGLLAFALLMANDLVGVAIGVFLFIRLSPATSTVLSLKPDVPNVLTWRRKKAA